MSQSAAIAQARCHIHADREAAARCVKCATLYCSECVTRVDGRMVCASCQRAAAAVKTSRTREWFLLNTTAQFAAGLLLIWFMIYFAGRILISIPDEMHSGKAWENLAP